MLLKETSMSDGGGASRGRAGGVGRGHGTFKGLGRGAGARQLPQ